MKKRLLLIGCVLMMSTAAVACSSTNQSTEAKQENMDSNKIHKCCYNSIVFSRNVRSSCSSCIWKTTYILTVP